MDWDVELTSLQSAVHGVEEPSVGRIRTLNPDPWNILVSTLISLRTRDAVTFSSSKRLLEQAPNPKALEALGEKAVAELIFPASFYRRKAAHLCAIAGILLKEYGGLVPSDQKALLALPGVGLKTVNLVLGLAYGIPAICVDTHVHRIANRRGWVGTDHPDATEAALRNILPKRWWIETNGILVRFGQTRCTPISPKCSDCPVMETCPRIGVAG